MKRKTGVELIAEERQRQIEVEGWTAEHDSRHKSGDLEVAAMCYACPPKYRPFLSPTLWFKRIGWDPKWWKPGERIRELQKSGALIAAAIDNLQNLMNENPIH